MSVNTPYDPFSAPMPSLSAIRVRARRRAHADTVAKMATLPSDAVLRQANASLINSLNTNLNDFRGLAGNLGGSYGAAVAPANAAQTSASAQLGAVGPVGQPDTRGGLLGAMAASTYGGLIGGRQAAAASLPGQLTALAGKRGALAAGENSLYENYLQQGYDDALKMAAARSNASLALGSQGIAQQNANAHMLSSEAAASQADTARRKLQQQKTGLDPATQRILDSAFKVFNDNMAGKGTTKKTIAGNYSFKIGDPLGVQPDITFTVRAKNGTEARNLAKARLGADKLKQYGGAWQDSWFQKMDPIQADVPNSGKGAHAALQAAISYLQTVGQMDHATAVAYARQWVPAAARKKPKKKKPPVDHVGGPH